MAKQLSNRENIEKKVEELLNDSYIDAKQKLSKALNSGAIDIENWDPNHNHWLLPKIIAIAILEDLGDELRPRSGDLVKKVDKEVKNVKLFL